MRLIHLILILINLMNTLAQTTETEGFMLVGGRLQPAKWKTTTSTEPLFNRNDYTSLSGTVVKIFGPNQFHVQLTDGNVKEFVLIGLMDISPIFNLKLRQELTEKISARYLGAKVQIHIPKDYEARELLPNHAFILGGGKVINAAIIEEGWGVVPEDQNFFSPLKDQFLKTMMAAAEKQLGLWKAPE